MNKSKITIQKKREEISQLEKEIEEEKIKIEGNQQIIEHLGRIKKEEDC